MQRISELRSGEARFELLWRMRAHGLKVRMHAFEYLIARRGFACIVLLEPSWNRAHILRAKWNCEEADRVSNLIAEMLLEADPEMKIETK